MFVEEVQNDLPAIIQEVRDILISLECAESCDSKEDFCDNLRTAILGLGEMKHDLVKILKAAKACRGYSAN